MLLLPYLAEQTVGNPKSVPQFKLKFRVWVQGRRGCGGFWNEAVD